MINGLKELPPRCVIFTQTMRDLGHPPWIPYGAYIIDVEPTDAQGFGVNNEFLLQAAVEEFHKKESTHAVLVSAKIEILPGDAHPSYCRRRMRITGDLYMRQV